jgi:speckle-type POZ protein
MILSRSPVFLAMFQHNMREGATGKVIVNSFEYRIMNELITFMYTNKVNELEEKAGDLLIAADYFDLTDLKEVCRTWLEANITLENFALSLQIADRYGIKSLKDSVLRFIIL